MGNKRKNETDEDYKVRRSKENALQYQKRKAKKETILAQKREKQRQYTRTHREKQRREAREAVNNAPASSSQGECAILKRIEALMGDMQEQVSNLASRLEESENSKKKLEEENAMLKAKIASLEKSFPAPQTPGKTQGC